MILLRRTLPFLGALLTAVLLEVLLVRQPLFWYFLPLLFVVTAYPIGALIGWRIGTSEFWQFLITPIMLVGSTLFFFLFLSNPLFAHLVVAATAVLFGWYCENLFLFYYRTSEYQPNALEHISLYANLLAVFFLYSSLYAARVFLALPYVVVIAVGTAAAAIFAFQMLAHSKVVVRERWDLFGGLALIMAEVFGVVALLPTTQYVAGLLIAIPYYLMMSITRHALRNTLTRSVLLRNAILGVLTFTVTVLAAPWS